MEPLPHGAPAPHPFEGASELIHFRGASVAFERPIFQDVELQIPKGCLYGLIGPGASGKTLLLKTVAGLIPLSRGEVWVDEQCVGELAEPALAELRARIGMLFQNNALFDFMTVEDNIAFPLRRLTALPEDVIRERVQERLSAVGLPGFGARLPNKLSGGQKKRVGVARATITGAPVLLYDEPAAGLDPVSTQKLLNLLREEQQRGGATAIMVSSDLDRLLTVTDRVGMLFEGRLIFDGTTDEARSCPDPYVHQFVHGLVEGPM